jgi:hypothetical protein
MRLLDDGYGRHHGELTDADRDAGNTTFLESIPEGEPGDEQANGHAWESEQQEVTTTIGIDLHRRM